MSSTNQTNSNVRNQTERNSNVSGSQPLDNSTVIRRTLVERGLRPVNNDENLTNGAPSSTIAAITTIAKQHQDEQRELQELNNKFAIYIDRVFYLEDTNQRLQADLNSLKQAWGADGAQLEAAYGPQLQAVRDALDNAIRDKALQEHQLKRYEDNLYDLQQQLAIFDDGSDENRLNILRQELNSSNIELDELGKQLDQSFIDLTKQQHLMDSLLKDLNDLKNELDTQQLERIILENELQTLREHAAFQDAIYQSQRKELLTLNTPVLDVSRFYRTELARAISDIRQDFEVLSQSQVNELEEYYRVKTEEVRAEIESENERKRLLASEGVIESMDTTHLTAAVKDTQNDLLALKDEYKQLQSLSDAIENDLETIREENTRQNYAYDQEFGQLQQQLNDKKETIDSILQNNVSLRFEISTYRRLLAVEEQHLNKVEQEQQLPPSSSSSSSFSTSISPSSGTTLGALVTGASTVPSSYQSRQPSSNQDLNDLGTKKMTVQKTARGPISIDSVDLETDAVILVNTRYSGNDQSFRNWTIRREIDQQPEIIYQFPATFSLRPRQTIRIFSKRSPHAARSIGDRLIADRIDTWGIGQKMVTRLFDDNNDEKAIITQIFQ